MSIHFYVAVFLLVAVVLSNVNAQTPVKQYVIRKDFFRLYKAAEFTVYDTKEKHVYYRIESKVNLLKDVKLIAYPLKKEVGRLKSKINFITYKAEFSILDPKSNEWIDGTLRQTLKLFSDLLVIEWGGHRITMEMKAGSFTHVFLDSDGGEILAELRLRPASIFWTNKYDLKIFSNKYPEQVYLLIMPMIVK